MSSLIIPCCHRLLSMNPGFRNVWAWCLHHHCRHRQGSTQPAKAQQKCLRAAGCCKAWNLTTFQPWHSLILYILTHCSFASTPGISIYVCKQVPTKVAQKYEMLIQWFSASRCSRSTILASSCTELRSGGEPIEHKTQPQKFHCAHSELGKYEEAKRIESNNDKVCKVQNVNLDLQMNLSLSLSLSENAG